MPAPRQRSGFGCTIEQRYLHVGAIFDCGLRGCRDRPATLPAGTRGATGPRTRVAFRLAVADDDLSGFERGSFTHAGTTHELLRCGSGPAVIVIAEMPGITPKVFAFARMVAGIGCSAVLPVLFGEPGRDPVPRMPNPLTALMYAADSLLRACISLEFAVWATGRSSPVVDWLRALAVFEHEQCGGPGAQRSRAEPGGVLPRSALGSERFRFAAGGAAVAEPLALGRSAHAHQAPGAVAPAAERTPRLTLTSLLRWTNQSSHERPPTRCWIARRRGSVRRPRSVDT